MATVLHFLVLSVISFRLCNLTLKSKHMLVYLLYAYLSIICLFTEEKAGYRI